MMQNWKHELEELLYHLGIYLSQDGYPVICAAADLVLQEPERLRRLMTEFTWRWPSAAVAQRPAWNAASRTTVATAWEANPTLFQKNGHERNYPATHGRRFPLHGAALPAAGLRGIVLTGTGARSRAGPKFFFF